MLLSAPASLRALDDALGYALAPSAGTASKPQSKVWYNDGSYWCVLAMQGGNRIFELRGDHWVMDSTLTLGASTGRADVLWDGTSLEVLVFDDPPQFDELSYDASRRSYRRKPGFPIVLPIPAGSETMVLDEDSRGRLWATYLAGGRVYVTHSTTDHLHWELPGDVLGEGALDDDVSTVVAFGEHRIGVLWSDQAREILAFRDRSDQDPLDAWSPLEVVHGGPHEVDDHVHACTDAAGNLYAVTKTGRHELNVHQRTSDGTWTTVRNVLHGEHATRPILVTAEADGRLIMLYTRWHAGPEIIEQRVSPLGRLDFGAPQPFLVVSEDKIRLKDVTSTKRSLAPGSVLAIAWGGGMAWWNGWGAGTGAASERIPEMATLEASWEPVDSRAILALTFDEATGHEVGDASPSGVSGALGGPWAGDASEPTRVRGVSGRALHFDGRRDYVTVTGDAVANTTGNVTIEAWFRRESRWTNDAILCKGTAGQRTWQLRILKNDRVEFLREYAGGVGRTKLRSKMAVEDSSWHHAAAVVDLDDGQTRLYVDGHLEADATDSSLAAVNPTPVYIGARVHNDRLREWFHGDIDEVRVYPYARYETDFVPPKEMIAESGRCVFLSWNPRYVGPARPGLTFDIYRSLDGKTFTKLNSRPLHASSCVDHPAPSARPTYRVEISGHPESGVLETSLATPPSGSRP